MTTDDRTAFNLFQPTDMAPYDNIAQGQYWPR